MAENNFTGFEMLAESRTMFTELLYQFRECHDLCANSNLFRPEIILEIDTCAVTFRQLSLDTVRVAHAVSNQWLNYAIMFFEFFHDIKDEDRKTTLALLGNQAKDLSLIFMEIAASARNLSGKFHAAQNNTTAESGQFKRAFEEALFKAEMHKKSAEKNKEEKALIRKEAEHSERIWNIVHVLFFWEPITSFITHIGSMAAEKNTAKAAKIEEEAAVLLHKAAQTQEKRKQENTEAQVQNRVAGLPGRPGHTNFKLRGNLESFTDILVVSRH